MVSALAEGRRRGEKNVHFCHVSNDTNQESSTVHGWAEGRRRAGGGPTIIEKRFENLVILNGMWIGRGAAKGRRQVFGEVLGFPAEGRRRGGGGAAEGRRGSEAYIWRSGATFLELKI